MKIFFIESGSRIAKIKAETKEEAVAFFVYLVRSNRMQSQLGLVIKATENGCDPSYILTKTVKASDLTTARLMKIHRTKAFSHAKDWRNPCDVLPRLHRGLRLFNGKAATQDGEKFVEMTHKTKRQHRKHTRNRKGVVK